ncbi:hypothetical protein EHI8A_144970 [Entamoeba histolytica HM-1:IMSS-B]|uniref:Uncharacterized protein n=6 Tax=Entamoeba histolytica TaxID=5759 RepID=B1N2W6_ENTH1|nr:hypothetical protein EHI_131210 [Entamoeba histolytica HM-1:IMSS]EMD48087.1 Hypothetical protein EHI5A_070160 [Entamoeba histolytica KU27]EMH73260.1 hypothetical protein EHI8A_144970 [Entamoeba histolytica HM-1:IMSS-B]EMS16363.1 hypothetical protein KM1_230390 [Entamoeba histolytica HM-3:IMSS]ENY62095.1 hypothetical protein EHI7A_127780 [Entamoeba histolytica HM-1:IMSS-A]GAT93469.1 hypothetical protein CL6EHI_131210 [Entamoeba histolytica]|eukprot:XP_001913532.1 hypothetical protein EHI_131210 [Entamoeba histolytica HM-1:IMSS]
MIKINLTLILRGLYAFCGLLVILCGLIHLCKWGWSNWSIHGVKSNASVICGFVALLLMVNGIYMIISPWAMFIPVAKQYINFWNAPVTIAWLIVTGIITLFYVGFFGLFTSIIIWLVSIYAIVVVVLSCVKGGDEEQSSEDKNDPYNP